VPRAALLPGDGGSASQVALVRPDGTVEHRATSLGSESDDRVEIKRGLGPGERVIVAGGYALPDGTKVVVQK
jgi:multidrug efflux pump subunit AcrA (membrane-fusion protein)